MSKAFKILISVAAVLVILVIAGCAISLASFSNSVESDQKSGQDFAQVVNQIQLGMNIGEVQDIAGDPSSESEASSIYAGVVDYTYYMYYGVLNGCQLVFESEYPSGSSRPAPLLRAINC